MDYIMNYIMDYIVYIITNCINQCTYVGITNHPERRIRQHNGELKGGARYTKKYQPWNYYGFILGCEKREALSIEKKIHIHSRKTSGSTPLERRIKCIQQILNDFPHLSFTFLE